MNVIIATEGEYSDYSVRALLNWLSDKTPEEAREAYLEKNPKQREYYSFNTDMFISWLIIEGYAEELQAQELHIGDYGSVGHWKRTKFESGIDLQKEAPK